MTEAQKDLFGPGKNKITISGASDDDEHKAMILKNENGSVVCCGFIVGDNEPPSEDLIRSVVKGKGWKVKNIKHTDYDNCKYHIIVYVVC